jgi:uncharacterized protein (TIGR04255 family)
MGTSVQQTANMTPPLPDFERPPLNEVALSIQFEPLSGFGLPHFGLFWSRVRDRYPRNEDKTPLAHIVEASAPKPQKGLSAITVQEEFPPPRCWLLDQSGNSLIQLQRDRFVRNWRQIDGSEVYPRYSTLSKLFFQEWEHFVAFACSESLGHPKINQCEVTYVYHLEPGIGWRDFSNLDGLFSFVVPRKIDSILDGPDLFGWNARYKLPGGYGAGHVKVDTVFRGRDLKLILAMNLVARGAPTGTTETDVSAWFNVAHEWIVRTFDELTNDSMHKVWGKKT